MNENYSPIGDNNQDVQPNVIPAGVPNQAPQEAPAYEFNANDVVYSDDNSYVANDKKDGKKVLLYILGIIIIIIIILLLLKFCGLGGKLTDIKIGDVPIMYVDEEYKVPVSAVGKGNRDNTQFEFSIANNTIAELKERYQTGSEVNAEIKALEPGTTTLEVIGKLGKEEITKEAEVIVCKKFELDGLTNGDTVTVSVGEIADLGLNLGDSERCYQGVTFSFADDGIAKIVNNDDVEGIAKGETELVISNGDEEIIIKIVVDDPNAKVLATGITVSAKSITVYVGNTKTVKATVKPSNASNKKVTWSSNNSKIATVTQGGKVKGIKVGTTKVTVKTTDGSNKSATITVRVKKKTVTPPTPPKIKVTDIILSPTALSVKVGATGKITAGIKPDNASNKTVTCKSSNTAIFTVTSSGNVCTITGVKKGSAQLEVTANDGSGIKKTATITVTSSGGGGGGGSTGCPSLIRKTITTPENEDKTISIPYEKVGYTYDYCPDNTVKTKTYTCFYSGKYNGTTYTGQIKGTTWTVSNCE